MKTYVLKLSNCHHSNQTEEKHFPSNQNLRKFLNGDKQLGGFLRKLSQNPKIVEFPQSEPFNRTFRKCREENQMTRKFTVRNFRKYRNFCIPCKVVFFYGDYIKCYSIRYWKFPKMQFNWSNAWKALDALSYLTLLRADRNHRVASSEKY